MPQNRNLSRSSIATDEFSQNKKTASGTLSRWNVVLQIRHCIEQRRLFILLPFLLLAGIVLYRVSAQEPDPIFLALIGAGLTGVFLWAAYLGRFARWMPLVFALWGGFSLLPLHGYLFGSEMLTRAVYGEFEARIDKILSVRDDGQRIIVSNLVPLSGARELPIKRARLLVREGPMMRAGDVIRGPIRLGRVPGPVVVGGFDSQLHAYFDGIGAYGNSTRPPIIVGTTPSNPLLSLIEDARRNIGLRIDDVLDQPARSIARALTVGDQSGISNETRRMMAEAGLAHVLAISGLHLTLVAGGVFFGMRMLLSASYSLGQFLPVKKVAAVVGIVAALIYLALSGASVSAVRATVMIVLVFGAVLVGRRAITMRTVAFAALFVIVTDPVSVFRPSFQLSFSAVVALVGVYEILPNRRASQHYFGQRILTFFVGMAITSFVAGAATALFAAYHFQQTSPLGVLGNLAALPLVGFVILPSAFTAVLLMPLGFEAPFLHIMATASAYILEVARIVSGWSSGISGSPLILPVSLVFGLAALAWFSFFDGRLRLLGPAVGLVLIATTGLDTAPDVIVADSTKAIAVRGDDGLALISGRTGSFAVNAWEETYQEPIASKMIGVRCDLLGCIYRSPEGFVVALVKSRAAFREDCTVADLVVTRIDAPQSCSASAQVIDFRDLRYGGMHWLSWRADQNAFVVRPAIYDTNRPWRIVGRNR